MIQCTKTALPYNIFSGGAIMTIHKHLYWLPALLLCAALSGCGQKGDLYPPDNRAGEQKQQY